MLEQAPSKDHEEAAMQPQMEHWWVVQDSVLVMSWAEPNESTAACR